MTPCDHVWVHHPEGSTNSRLLYQCSACDAWGRRIFEKGGKGYSAKLSAITAYAPNSEALRYILREIERERVRPWGDD